MEVLDVPRCLRTLTLEMPGCGLGLVAYRGTSIIRKCTSIEPYSRLMPMDVWES